MPKIGLQQVKYCPLTITETNGVVTETLGVGATIGKGMKADISIKTSEAKMYADDALAESAYEFIGGSIALELAAIEDAVIAGLLGHTVTGSEISANANDVAPYTRTGFIVPLIVNNVKKFRVICLMKVKYAIPSESFESKGETLSFNGTKINGEIFRNKDGLWKKEKTHVDLAAAQTYLNGLLGIV